MTLHMTIETPDHLLNDLLEFVKHANMGILNDLYHEWNLICDWGEIVRNRRIFEHYLLQAMRLADITTRNIWIRDYLGYSSDVSTLPSYDYEALMNVNLQQ